MSEYGVGNKFMYSALAARFIKMGEGLSVAVFQVLCPVAELLPLCPVRAQDECCRQLCPALGFAVQWGGWQTGTSLAEANEMLKGLDYMILRNG